MKLSAEDLHAVLLIFREHLLPCWRQFHAEVPHGLPLAFRGGVPEAPSSQMCQQTAAFLYRQFERLGIEDVELCGGSMRHAERLEREDPSRRDVDVEGYVWAGHYWLEHNGMVIDITKDQFGWEFDHIHDSETAELIYWKRPDLFPESHLGMFAVAVSKFEGTFQSLDGNDHYLQVGRSFDLAMERAAAVLGTTSARLRN
jgi:hypothetical protein